MERALLDELKRRSESSGLKWATVEDVVEMATRQWDGVSASTDVAWRRAALSLARKGLVEVAYQPMTGMRRRAAVRLPAQGRADSDALATAAVRDAVIDLWSFQHLPAFTHGMVFAFSRWDGRTSDDATLRAVIPPSSDVLVDPTGHQRRYERADEFRWAARSLVRLSNWIAADGNLVLQLDWLPAFLDAAAADDNFTALEHLKADVSSRAEAWFWGEISTVQREEQIAALPNHQSLGKRGKPPVELRHVVRKALFDALDDDLPVGYHDSRANLRSDYRPVSDIFIRQR